jgi:hypothetical protein
MLLLLLEVVWVKVEACCLRTGAIADSGMLQHFVAPSIAAAAAI